MQNNHQPVRGFWDWLWGGGTKMGSGGTKG
jgi:hypothetical protein